MADGTEPSHEMFTCARCGGVFEKGWSDEEAEAEWGAMRDDLGFRDDEPRAVICDDCHREFTGWLATDEGQEALVAVPVDSLRDENGRLPLRDGQRSFEFACPNCGVNVYCEIGGPFFVLPDDQVTADVKHDKWPWYHGGVLAALTPDEQNADVVRRTDEGCREAEREVFSWLEDMLGKN